MRDDTTPNDQRLLHAPDEILTKALEKETQARDFYARLTEGCSVGFVRELLYQLKDEESKHIRMIRDMMARMGTGHSVPPSDR